METEYKTRDLYEAAFLVAKGILPTRLEQALNSSRYFFIFGNFADCTQLVSDFWNKKGLVDPRTYSEAINYLKDRLFARS